MSTVEWVYIGSALIACLFITIIICAVLGRELRPRQDRNFVPSWPPAPRTFRITTSAVSEMRHNSALDELREKRLEILRKDLVG